MWTEDDFQRIALSTRLSTRTVAACRAILVDGVSGVEAGALHKMHPAQISRALGVLRDRQEELVESAKTLQSESALLKYTAVQVAKNIVGAGLEIADAEPGKTYEGQVIVNTHGFLVQKVGRIGVIHDLGKLEARPTLNAVLEIKYPQNGGKAAITDKTNTNEPGKNLGR